MKIIIYFICASTFKRGREKYRNIVRDSERVKKNTRSKQGSDFVLLENTSVPTENYENMRLHSAVGV